MRALRLLLAGRALEVSHLMIKLVSVSEPALRALRTIANHPGATAEEVAERGFDGDQNTADCLLHKLKKLKLVQVGYALTRIQRGHKAESWEHGYAYFVSRAGYEVLKCDERWTSQN